MGGNNYNTPPNEDVAANTDSVNQETTTDQQDVPQTPVENPTEQESSTEDTTTDAPSGPSTTDTSEG